MWEIREAVLEDVAAISHLHLRSWLKVYRGLLPDSIVDGYTLEEREAFWRERFLSHPVTTFVAEKEGRMAGWIVAGASRLPDAEKDEAELIGLYIDPDFWRQGVGSTLWNHAKAELMAESFVCAAVLVLHNNRGAETFYEKLGFAQVPARDVSVNWRGADLPHHCLWMKFE